LSQVTTVFCGICAEHVAPQLMPETSLVTVLPLVGAEPVFVTVSGNVTPAKLAVTVRAWFMVTMQLPVPGQLNPASVLLHPRNVLPADGVAVRVTLTPLLKSNEAPEHDTPQVLADYAKKAGADPKRWKFLTGDPKAVAEVASRFGILYYPDHGQIVHGQGVAVIDPRGRVATAYFGNDWQPEHILRDLEAARKAAS